MAKAPQPPPADVLRERTGLRPRDARAVSSHEMLWRIHRTAGPRPIAWKALRHYGPVATCRYDPQPSPRRWARERLPTGPDKPEGVMYLAASAQTALAEAFQARRLIDRHTDTPYLVGLHLTRSVRLLDLAGGWPARAGTSQTLNSGRRDVARSWARAVRAAFPDLDGLWYPSSMDGRARCVTLWNPAADALPRAPDFSRPLADPALADRLAAAADRLGYRLL